MPQKYLAARVDPRWIRHDAHLWIRPDIARFMRPGVDLQAAIHAALRKRNGGAVVGQGTPARWRLKEAAN